MVSGSKNMVWIALGLALLTTSFANASTLTPIAGGILDTVKGDVNVDVSKIHFNAFETIPCHYHFNIGLQLSGEGGVDGFVLVTEGELKITQKGVTTSYQKGDVILEPTQLGMSHKAEAGPDGADVVIWRTKPSDQASFRILVDDAHCDPGAD